MKFDGGRQSDEKPVTRTETLQHANPDLYPTVVTITTILLTMPVATATPSSTFVSYPLHTAQVNNTFYARSLVSSGEQKQILFTFVWGRLISFVLGHEYFYSTLPNNKTIDREDMSFL